jgi:predicted O-methyltransferase YrrM
MKDYYKIVPGWFNCPDLYSHVVDKASSLQPSTFVEIGCWKGKSTSYMAEQIMLSGKPITFHCVDTWRGTTTESHHQLDPDVANDRLFEVFTANMSPFAGYYQPIRSLSVEAAAQFGNNSLDFIYIDASHEYKDVVDDINAWMPKLKAGGIIAGDDYNSPDVSRAVHDTIRGVNVLNRFTWAHTKKV